NLINVCVRLRIQKTKSKTIHRRGTENTEKNIYDLLLAAPQAQLIIKFFLCVLCASAVKMLLIFLTLR
ncbi:MAG: hypothetical protein LJE83_05860, partial [Gammaproteobacteria bacterium]|nr:hypothetical protein [Gammaproteobacteria bacterium]